MNVFSLPDEMQASALKYNSFEDLTAVRKISSKIDSVARRYGLDKLRAERIEIIYRNTEVEMYIDIVKPRKDYIFRQPSSVDLLHILKYYFSKIRGVKDLFLFNDKSTDLTKMSISNEVGEFLIGNGCNNIPELSISGWDISISFNTMRRIMTKLKPKKLYIRSSFTEFEFTDAVIEGIPFDCLKLYEARAEKPLGISLPYLTRLCDLKIPSTLHCTIYNSTISDLITLFEMWTKYTIHTLNSWDLTISKDTMSLAEIKQNLAKLKCFEDCIVTHSKDDRDIGRYCIAHKLSSSTFVNPWTTKIFIAVLR